MKKFFAVCFIVLVFAALLCVTAFAADDPGIYVPKDNTSDYTVEAKFYGLGTDGKPDMTSPKSPDKTVTIGDKEYDYYADAALLKLTVTVTGDPASYYLVLATTDETKLDSKTITYIDQKTGSATIEFTVYPSTLAADNYVYLAESGGTGRKGVLTFKYVSDVMLGDVDGNGKVMPKDALWALQAYNTNRTLTDQQKRAADVDHNGKVMPKDALWILQAYNGNRDLS